MTTVLTDWFRGGDPPVSLEGVDFEAPVKGDDPAAAARAGRALAYGTTGGPFPGLYNPAGSHEVHDGDSEVLHATAPARGAAVDGNTTVGTAPFAGTVTSVTYTPAAPITGADTDSRTVKLVNLGTPGDVVVASFDFTNGNDGPPLGMSMAITLSGTLSDLVVAEGDVLQWQSVHVGAGLADPGGVVSATLNS